MLLSSLVRASREATAASSSEGRTCKLAPDANLLDATREDILAIDALFGPIESNALDLLTPSGLMGVAACSALRVSSSDFIPTLSSKLPFFFLFCFRRR